MPLDDTTPRRGGGNGFDGYTIYERPTDCPLPDCYVLRHWVLRDGQHVFDDVAVATPIEPHGLEILRYTMRAEGRTCFPRKAEDDPVIVESWV